MVRTGSGRTLIDKDPMHARDNCDYALYTERSAILNHNLYFEILYTSQHLEGYTAIY